jgi:light-regulated signal transduction histidine kinase (bacteriophytochrome)
MEYFIALTEAEARTLTVVDIGAGLKTYFVKNLKDVSKRLHNKKVTAKVKTGGGAGITKSIQYLVDGEVLFSISSRFTGKVYRNFITTGPLLRSFLSGEL